VFSTLPQIKAKNHLNDFPAPQEYCHFWFVCPWYGGELWIYFPWRFLFLFFCRWFAGSLQVSHLAPLAFPLAFGFWPEWFHVKRWLFSPKMRCPQSPPFQKDLSLGKTHTLSANWQDIYGLWACSAFAVGGGALSMFLPLSLASRFAAPPQCLPNPFPTPSQSLPLPSHSATCIYVFVYKSMSSEHSNTHTIAPNTHMRVFMSNRRFIIFGCVANATCRQHIKIRKKRKDIHCTTFWTIKYLVLHGVFLKVVSF